MVDHPSATSALLFAHGCGHTLPPRGRAGTRPYSAVSQAGEKSMLEPRSALLLPLAVAGLVAATPLAQAQDFYKGKTLTIVVGFSPGGGYDVNARRSSRHIAKHIPGNPSIIVQNMPSAGSMT